jgi:hypothetical protein
MWVYLGHDGVMMIDFVKLMLLAVQPNKSSSSLYSPKPKSHRSSSSTEYIPGAVLVREALVSLHCALRDLLVLGQQPQRMA